MIKDHFKNYIECLLFIRQVHLEYSVFCNTFCHLKKEALFITELFTFINSSFYVSLMLLY